MPELADSVSEGDGLEPRGEGPSECVRAALGPEQGWERDSRG